MYISLNILKQKDLIAFIIKKAEKNHGTTAMSHFG